MNIWQRRPLLSGHPFLAMFLCLLMFGVFLKLWPLFVLAAIAWGVWKVWEQQQRRLDRRRHSNELVAARADYEHRMFLNGDPVGVYGQYQPPPV